MGKLSYFGIMGEMEKFQNPEERTEKIRAFQEKYLPESMRTQKKVNVVISAGMELMYARQANIEGRDKLPESGPFIVVANHFNVKETEMLLAILKDHDAHIVASNKVHGEHPIRKMGLQAIRGLSAPESFANLTDEEKQELINRVPDTFIREKYQEIVDQEESGELDRSGLIDFVKSSVALLSRGDVLVIYPEGLWLYDGADGSPREHSLYKAYDGFSVVAEQYKKLTGEDVPIIPISFSEQGDQRAVKVGDPSTLRDNDTDLSNADWYMKQVSDMLPEEQRGYYKDIEE
jgi:1-acyl-sn-glycerol-3-phosphate acyltransferase